MNDDFETHLHQRLRDAEQNIDPHNRSQLAAARREALQQPSSGIAGLAIVLPRGPAWGALAAALLIGVVVTQVYTPPAATPAPELTVDQQLELYENLQMLEFLELYEELEFNELLATDMPAEIRT